MSSVAAAKSPPGGSPDSSRLRRIVSASMAGTVVEWYEFYIYATAVTLVFSKIYFPESTSQIDAVIAGFVTYAVGFAARPLGGIVFSYFGDRFGRKKMLQISLALVGVATFLIGCIPTFATIGYWAPAALVTLRFIQGMAVGGEWGGAVLLVSEQCPDDKRGFWSSWTQAAVPVGNLVANGVLLVLAASMSETAFVSWGWRIAFWASALIVIVGYYIRRDVHDAAIYTETKEKIEEHAAPVGVVTVIREYPRNILTAMGLRLGENVLYFLVVTFSITYLKLVVQADTSRILKLIVLAHALHFIAIPTVGALSDRIGRRPCYIIGATLGATWGFFAFPMMHSGSDLIVLLAIALGLLVHAFMYAPQAAIMTELYPTRLRYSGASFGYQVTSVVAGSLAPIIALKLYDNYSSSTPIAIYCAITAGVSLIAALFLRESKGISLRSLDDADRITYPTGQPVPAHP